MACCETYIISLATVRDITGLAKIVSDVKLAPFLRLSQQELEKVLGRTLYDELDDAVQADSTLTGETALIALMRYVKYALAWRTLQRALPRMAAEPTANGVHTVSDGAYQSSDRALTHQITDARTAADEAYTLLIDFLKNNLTTYPTYETEVENEERVKKMYTGGVITRKSRWQYPYGLKTPSNGNQYDECCDDAN